MFKKMARQKLNIHPLVSVILPSLNSKNYIDTCLKGLLKTNYPNYEVILIDDYSSDGSLEYIRDKYGKNKKLKIYKNPKNLKLAATRNRGIKEAKGKYVAFVEVDMDFDKNWLKYAVETLEKDESLAGVQARVMDIKLRSRLQFMNIYMWPQTGWMITPDSLREIKDDNFKSKEILGGPNSMIYRKQVLEKVGKFDDKFGFNIDDLDLNWRLWLSGFRIVTEPRSVIYHWTVKDWSQKGGGMPRSSWEFEYAKMPRIFIKNYNSINLFYYLTTWFIIILGRSLINMARGNSYPLRGFLSAIYWNIQVLPDTLAQRKHIQGNLRKKSDSEVLSKIAAFGSVFSFYRKLWLGTRRKTMQYIKAVKNV